MKNTYYSTLLLLAKLTNHFLFKPIHKLVANIYVKIIVPQIETHLKLSVHDQEVYLKPRHSVKSKNNFNCFLSDLDLSVVFKDSTDKLNCVNVVRRLKELKKFLPFIGEVEIYTQLEIDELSKLQLKERSYDFLRNLRKIIWMKKSFATGATEYHRYKALRSIDLIYKNNFSLESNSPGQLEKAITIWANANFAKELGLIQTLLEQNEILPMTEVYSDFLGYNFSSQPVSTARVNQLILEKKYIALLLALAPEDHHTMPQLNNSVSAIITSVPTLRTVRQNLARIEALVVLSWSKTQEPVPDWAPLWINRLEQISTEN